MKMGMFFLMVIMMGVIGILRADISRLEKQVVRNHEYDKQMVSRVKNALKLQRVSTWYIVNAYAVSSEKDGKGEVITFTSDEFTTDGRLRDQGNREGIIHVEVDRKVVFSVNEKYDGENQGLYTVEGGLLNYKLE